MKNYKYIFFVVLYPSLKIIYKISNKFDNYISYSKLAYCSFSL